MNPLAVEPQQVPVAVVRRVSQGAEDQAQVTPVEVTRVVPPIVLPRQVDPLTLRLMALQLENEHLRAELDEHRSA